MTAFPGHAGRCLPLPRWRSVARTGESPNRDRPGDRMGVASHRLARDSARAGAHRRDQHRARHGPVDRRDEEVGDGHADRLHPPRGLHPARHAGRQWRRGTVDVRRPLRRRRLLADPQGVVPARRVRRGADEPDRAGGGRLLPGRVLRAVAVQRARHGDDDVEPRPRQRVHRPRAAVDPRLHDGGVAQARHEEQRGGRQVLPPRCVRQRRAAVRHEPVVRRHGLDAARRHRRFTA